MSEAKLKKIRLSLDHKFSEIAREARKAARDEADKGVRRKILEGLAEADDKRLDAEIKLMFVDLTSTQTAELIKALDEKTNKATELLDVLRKKIEILENLKKAADLAASFLTTVAKFI